MVSEKLGAAFIEVGVDTGKLTTGLAAAKAQAMGLGSGVSSTFSGMVAAINPATIAIAAFGAAVLAVGAALKSSVTAAADFQQAMANVSSVTGGGADQLGAISAAAREAGSSTVFSAREAADAEYYLASAGMSTDEIIASLNDTLLLAGAGGMEMGRSAEIVTGTLAQFNMEAEESNRVVNVMAAAASGSNTTINQLGDGMKNAGAFANAAGVSFEMTSAALMVFADSNIKGAEGGTALKSVIASLLTFTPRAEEALAEMGLTTEDVSLETHTLDEVLQTLEEHEMTAAQSSKIFGKEMAGAGTVIVAGAGDLKTYTAEITNTSKAQEMYNTQTDTFQGAMKMLGSAVEEAKISLGNVFLPILTDAVHWLTEGVTAATNFGKSIYDMYGKVAAAEEKLGAFGVGEMVGYALNPAEALGGAFGWAKGKLGFETGKEIGEDLTEGVAEGTEGVGPAIEENLENVDGESAGEDMGHAAGTGYRNAWNEEMQRRADFHEPSSSRWTRSGFFGIGGDEAEVRYTEDVDLNWKFLVNGEVISHAGGPSGPEFLKKLAAKYPALAMLIDPRELEAAIEEAKGNKAAAADIRAQIQIDLDMAAAAEDLRADLETKIAEFRAAVADEMGEGIIMDWDTAWADLGDQAAKVFSDNLISGVEAQDMVDLYDAMEIADPAKFNEMGGDAGRALWQGLLDAIEVYSEYKINMGVKADPDTLTKMQADIVAAAKAVQPLAIESELLPPDLSALGRALWWEDWGGKEAREQMGWIAGGFEKLGLAAESAGGEVEAAWGVITDPDNFDVETVVLAIERIAEAFPEESPALIAAIATFFSGNVEKGIARAGESGLPDWWSKFGKWEETTPGLFLDSYIGPESGYGGRGQGARAGHDAENYFTYGVRADTSEADAAMGALKAEAEAKKITPIDADISMALVQNAILEAALTAPVTKIVRIKTVTADEATWGGAWSASGFLHSSSGAVSSVGGSLQSRYPNIHFLASGGIASNPIPAIVGDARTPEVVAPLGDLMPMIQQAVAMAGGGGVTVNAPITVYGGGDAREIAHEVAEELKIQISEAYVGRIRGGP